jgi:hypothetical protein
MFGVLLTIHTVYECSTLITDTDSTFSVELLGPVSTNMIIYI